VCWTETEQLVCDERAPMRARAWLRERLGPRVADALDPATALFGVTLVASELVTNAVQAECAELAIALTVHHDWVRIDVDDDVPSAPRLGAADVGASSGRGLAITAALAREWGFEMRTVGKQVWAELPLPATFLTDEQCTIAP
jgi:histidine kinase/DNA gyrase B/HSP90-like ATPase